jgi:hypothetical protein
MTHSALRVAATRSLGIWLALYAVFLFGRSLTLAVGDDAWVFRIAVAFAVLVALGWVASVIVRRPRLFAPALMGGVVVLLLFPAAWQTWDGRASLQLRARERDAFDYLRTVETFEGPVIGFGARYSGGFLAMRILSRSPQADAAFKELLRTGTTAGRVYGWIGVRKTDPSYYRQVAGTFARDTTSVPVLAGCVMDSQRVSELAAWLEQAQPDAWSATSKLFPEAEVRAAEAAYRFRE